jgi:hypothetical protein
MTIRYYANTAEFRAYLTTVGFLADADFHEAITIGISWEAPAKFEVVRVIEREDEES